jgi:alanyl-tRNA synthetase
MTAKEIRQTFFDFFISKNHKIVPSAPIVNKDDSTLMFTNAGMNQFKDFFLGHQTPVHRRIADTQKCLRVSGKHNDLEEVGRDGYHHTMFEMLGNWSFGDYFKKEAIEWSWELLTTVYGLPKDRLYATVFEGSPSENLEPDSEALELWKQWLPTDHIIYGNKKDNFWEMGDQGPCGPCSEIHIDLRSDAEREKLDGAKLVNTGDSRVVEIWNNVFIQFNRKADGTLEELPEKHVDTGMGFERLTMALQSKLATYDTDIFMPIIQFIQNESNIEYTNNYSNESLPDIAMRVVADHIRAVCFAIADGQLPGNTGAGYVIRRILRRAVRYYYSFLGIKEPFLCRIVPLLANAFSDVFPELKAQESQVGKIIQSEEKAFLTTLENGLKRFADLNVNKGTIAGEDAFELYDTFGFPIDLTRLMAEEKGWKLDEAGFEKAMQSQKERARAASQKETSDWQIVRTGEESEFLGYDVTSVQATKVLKFRTVRTSKASQYQVILSVTPFYAESGGQAGDKGWLKTANQTLEVLDTLKENDLIIHVLDKLPEDLSAEVEAIVDAKKRQATSSNHSATHLMHSALHRVIGKHALQKGQDVDEHRLRFDFSHFQKITEEEILQIESMVNSKIRENIRLDERRLVPIEEAKQLGAMMLFGEKYGDKVRVITFDPEYSRELCGGTHVQSTGEIGLFKIISESAVAAGIRRIEAVTATSAEQFLLAELGELNELRSLLKGQQHLGKAISAIQEENRLLKKQVESLIAEKASHLKSTLKSKVVDINGYRVIAELISLSDANALKTLAYQLEEELGKIVIVFGAEIEGKPQLMVAISKQLTEGPKPLHAGNIVRELAKEIQGGGGGQPFFATAGGKNLAGLGKAIRRIGEFL